MKFIYILIAVLAVLSVFYATSFWYSRDDIDYEKFPKSIYDIPVTSIDGESVSLAKYKGKNMLIVNVASRCGYTKQYKGLQALYEKYKDSLIVLGFPSNDFLRQEPGSNEEIKLFCESNYRVEFPLFEKIIVKGKGQHPLYRWLSDKKLNGWNDKSPSWNFNKYFVGKDGELVQLFDAGTNPMSDKIERLIK